jgi:hypothetical protein
MRSALRATALATILGCTSGSSGVGSGADAAAEAARVAAEAGVLDDGAVEAGPLPLPCPEPLSGAPNAPWKAPETAPGSCVPGEWDAIASACAGDDAAACDLAKQQHARCWGCAYSRKNDEAFGAVIASNGIIFPNVGGCVALETGDASRDSCASTLGTAVFCAYLACGRCAAGAAAACRTAVQATGACASARALAEACLDGSDAGADGGAEGGVDGSTADGGLRRIAIACGLDAPAAEAIVVARFCGGSADGGADAGGD